jgi:3-dehydroquinate dehydratase type I
LNGFWLRKMRKPKICAAIVENNIKSVVDIQPLVDLFELRIDLVGDGWQDVAKELKKPWIACNRLTEEGGQWRESEARRIERLLHAIELGASIVDIELKTKNLENIVAMVKKRAGCLISSHDLETTPPLAEVKAIIDRQQRAGADICKVVTTARSTNDNWTLLEAVAAFPNLQTVCFAMGPLGTLSRVLSPLVGGYFTYASIETGKESAPGQVSVKDLIRLYEMMGIE